MPALYVFGGDDFALSRASADRTGDHVEGPYRYEVFEGVSHWIPEEVPKRTAEVLLSFLESVTTP